MNGYHSIQEREEVGHLLQRRPAAAMAVATHVARNGESHYLDHQTGHDLDHQTDEKLNAISPTPNGREA
jgi:hypothetical protein